MNAIAQRFATAWRGRPPGQAARGGMPHTLSGLLMRRAGAVVALVLVLGAALNAMGLAEDVTEEVRAAHQNARLMALLGQAAQLGQQATLQGLHELMHEGGLRHVELQLHNHEGQLLLDTATPAGPALLQAWWGQTEQVPVQWRLAWPDGGHWTVKVLASPAAEQSEAVANMAWALGVVAALALLLMGSVRVSIARSLQPLDRLLGAIVRLGDHDRAPLDALPRMPVRELADVVDALRRMDGALSDADAQCRRLGSQLQTLQEEERGRLARDLHDEMGQRLTAMRVIAAHHLRRQQQGSAGEEGFRSLQSHCECLQRELRLLLAGLQPLGSLIEPQAALPWARLHELLDGLAATWRESAGLDVRLAPCRGIDPADTLRGDLALLVYRITQEAMTNAARHAGASYLELDLRVEPAQDGTAPVLAWSVRDDGTGIADPRAALRKGNGLAGLSHRVFAAGGNLCLEAVAPGARRPGLRLGARLPLERD